MTKAKSDIVSRRTILVVDDDRLFGDVLKTDLESDTLQVTVVRSIGEAQAFCSQTSFDVILLDNNLPDGSGLELVPDILNLNDRAKIILVTAFPSFDNAVQALKNGVYDYISKPIDLDELHATIERALRASNLEAVEQVARYRSDQERREAVLIGFKNSFRSIQNLVQRAANTTAPVLITGETGTGKNVIAKMIHYQGENRDNPFISLNCAAIPDTLIESELFGVEKGAFTGAVQTRKGIFELADGGTLFLDEIGEMPAVLQAKLLSALEDRQIRRVGGDKIRNVDVRIIAATNVIPEKVIAEQRFRKDLFYRLSVIHIDLPPLRDRTEDIPDLCRYFVNEFAPHQNIQIPETEIEYLQKYTFPGNVRELRNIIERCLILQEGNFINPSKLLNLTETEDTDSQTEKSAGVSDLISENIEKNLTLPEMERQYILAMYAKHKNNLAHTSTALDVSLSTLKRKLREFGLR